MPTNGTLHIGRKSAENVLHAIRFARDSGRPVNTHVTISFNALGVSEKDAGSVFQDLRERVGRWWRNQRGKGRDIGSLAAVHSHANPAGSRHVHWLVHVPAELDREFRVVVAHRLRKITGRADLGDALHFVTADTPGSIAKYILRGIDPQYADYLHIHAASEGLVSCRRTGASRAIGPVARQSSGWKRSRKPGRQAAGAQSSPV